MRGRLAAMLLNDKTLYADAKDAVGSLKNVAAKIDSGQGTLGKLVNDPALYPIRETPQ